MSNQKFGQGDLAMLGQHRVKVLECIYDDDKNEWWYEVEGIDLEPPVRLLTREVPQSSLKPLN